MQKPPIWQTRRSMENVYSKHTITNNKHCNQEACPRHCILSHLMLQAKQDQQKSVQLPFAHGDSGQQNGGSAKHSNGFVNSSHTQENHFFIGASSPSRSKQPASVTRKLHQSAHCSPHSPNTFQSYPQTDRLLDYAFPL